MVRQLLQYALQVLCIPLPEYRCMVLYDLRALLNVGDQAAVPVAHRFEKADRHALHIRRQCEQIGVGQELRQRIALYKAGQNHPVVFCRQLLDLLIVLDGIGGTSCQEKPLIRLYVLIGLQKVVQPLLRHNPAQRHDVGILRQSPALRDEVSVMHSGTFDAVRDIMRFPPILLSEILLEVF